MSELTSKSKKVINVVKNKLRTGNTKGESIVILSPLVFPVYGIQYTIDLLFGSD
jgi:hypothetical protein